MRPWPVLMYHRIGAVRRASSVPGHYVSEGLFARQMRLMRTLKMRAVDLESVAPDLAAGRDLPVGTFGITFDDGFRSFVTGAMPILKTFAWSATNFLVTDYVGQTNRWNECENDVVEPLMSWDEARAAHGEGHRLGSHTATHINLRDADLGAARDDIHRAREALSRELGPCPLFCYPYGGYRPETRDLVESAGYAVAFSTQKRPPETGWDPFLIPRINVRSDTPPVVLLVKLMRGGYLRRA